MLTNFDKAANLPAGPERDRLLTFVVVGGGFAGIEVFAELRSFASSLLEFYPQLSFDDTHFHLIEAMGRIMPEVSLPTSHWVIKHLAQRGAEIHLDTQLTSAVDGNIELSTGETFESDLIVWTAGVMANPAIVRSTDLPGRRARPPATCVPTCASATKTAGSPTPGAAGDIAAVPDLTGGGVGGYCVPNAQHAVRQGKLLAKNIVAVLRGEEPKEYFHKNLGAVAGLGVGSGVFQSGNIAIKGLIAWFAHRGYHGLAMPSVGAQVPRVLGLVEQLLARPRHRLALGRAAAARAVRGVRRPAEGRDRRRAAAEARRGRAQEGRAQEGRAQGEGCARAEGRREDRDQVRRLRCGEGRRRRAGRREVVWNAAPPSCGAALP